MAATEANTLETEYPHLSVVHLLKNRRISSEEVRIIQRSKPCQASRENLFQHLRANLRPERYNQWSVSTPSAMTSRPRLLANFDHRCDAVLPVCRASVPATKARSILILSKGRRFRLPRKRIRPEVINGHPQTWRLEFATDAPLTRIFHCDRFRDFEFESDGTTPLSRMIRADATKSGSRNWAAEILIPSVRKPGIPKASQRTTSAGRPSRITQSPISTIIPVYSTPEEMNIGRDGSTDSPLALTQPDQSAHPVARGCRTRPVGW